MPLYSKGKKTVHKKTGEVTEHASKEEAKKAAEESYRKPKKRSRLGH